VGFIVNGEGLKILRVLGISNLTRLTIQLPPCQETWQPASQTNNLKSNLNKQQGLRDSELKLNKCQLTMSGGDSDEDDQTKRLKLWATEGKKISEQWMHGE
jgi:hypothetical protein